MIVKPQGLTLKCSDTACIRISENVCCHSHRQFTAEQEDWIDCCLCFSASGHCYLCSGALIELFKQIKVTR